MKELEAFKEASETVEQAKKDVREAEQRLLLAEDAKRDAWVALQDAKRQVPVRMELPSSIVNDIDRYMNRGGR